MVKFCYLHTIVNISNGFLVCFCILVILMILIYGLSNTMSSDKANLITLIMTQAIMSTAHCCA